MQDVLAAEAACRVAGDDATVDQRNAALTSVQAARSNNSNQLLGLG